MIEAFEKIEFTEMFFEGINPQVEFMAYIVSAGQFYENLIKSLKIREIGKCKNAQLQISELLITARVDMNNVKNNTFNITAQGAFKNRDAKGTYIGKSGTMDIKNVFISNFVEDNSKLIQGKKLLRDVRIVIADTNEINTCIEE